MDQEVVNIVASKARAALDKVADNPNVPGLDASAVRTATRAVTEGVAPVVENLTNREPWHKSRVLVGNVTAVVLSVVGLYTLLRAGVTDAEIISVPIAALVANGYAIYGRVTTKPSLGSSS